MLDRHRLLPMSGTGTGPALPVLVLVTIHMTFGWNLGRRIGPPEGWDGRRILIQRKRRS